VGGIRPAELAAVRGRLEAFAEDVFESLPRTDQRARGACYLRGLMLDGRRKSVEPMAQRLGEVHYQALHHFVAVSPWDWRPVRRHLAERLVGALAPTAWAVDDTGFPKDGDHSVGVQRQYSGTLGKVANCQLGVSVNAVSEQASCPLDWRLFVPESWDDDTERRAACHLPEQVRHRPKWQLVLGMLDELDQWGLSPPVLVADAGHGEVGEFRSGLDDREIPYVVQVKADTSAYPERVRPTVAPYTGRGRRPQPRYRDKPCSFKQLALAAGQSACVELIWRPGQQGVAALPVPGPAGPAGRDHPAPTGRRACRQRGMGAAGTLAAGRMAHQRGRAGQVLAVQPARHHPDRGVGPAGQAAVADRTGLPGTEGRAGAGPLRRPQLWRLAPSRDPGLGRPRFPYPGAVAAPKTGGVGLTLWQLLGELQALLACWAGACPLCKRPAPRWLPRSGRSRAPT
jgi:DDE superfamily endonuclease